LDALAQNYTERATQDSLTRQIRSVLKGCNASLLIVDEAQHLVEGNSLKKDVRQVADWIKHLMNDTGVSIALVGISSITRLTESNEQLARRFSQKIRLKPYSADDKKSQNELLNLLCELVDKSGYKGDPSCLYRPTTLRRLCFATNGLVGYISPLVAEAIRLATEEKPAGELTRAHLSKAFRNQILPSAERGKNPFYRKFPERVLNGFGEPFYQEEM
jgi:DNA transposition AAA+ family ATPase